MDLSHAISVVVAPLLQSRMDFLVRIENGAVPFACVTALDGECPLREWQIAIDRNGHAQIVTQAPVLSMTSAIPDQT